MSLDNRTYTTPCVTQQWLSRYEVLIYPARPILSRSAGLSEGIAPSARHRCMGLLCHCHRERRAGEYFVCWMHMECGPQGHRTEAYLYSMRQILGQMLLIERRESGHTPKYCRIQLHQTSPSPKYAQGQCSNGFVFDQVCRW